MLQEFFYSLILKVLSYLPSWILIPFVSKEKLINKIDFNLRGTNPISITVGSRPEISIYFTLINRSVYKIVLDRVLLDIWDQQPLIQGNILDITEIKSGDKCGIYFSKKLSYFEAENIKKLKK